MSIRGSKFQKRYMRHKKNISFSCDTKFSQIFPKYQRLELFFENILVLFLDAIGSLPPIPGLQYTCHTDICHPDWTSGSPFVTHRYFLISYCMCLWACRAFSCGTVWDCLRRYIHTGWFFDWSRPEKFSVWNWSHPTVKKWKVHRS